MNKNLKDILNLEQSIWYDDLSQDLLASGKLAELLSAGIRGLTSNPSIFEKAIASSNLYDENIQHLKQQNLSEQNILDELMINDVAQAADLMLDIYQQSNKLDGYASLEVSPSLAYKTKETVEAATDYWQKLNRPNIMIKVPATPEGIPAIEELISYGININVTLIFSPKIYQDVITAYQAGLKKRITDGKSIDHIHSVASFFISRVDSWIENHSDDAELIGKVGLANGLAAYQVYQDEFTTAAYQELVEKGANKQRILWASTSTKNKDFHPLLYAASLPFKDSVATHPPALIEEICQLSDPISNYQTEVDYQSIFKIFDNCDLKQQQMYQDLLKEGVEKFDSAYKNLLKTIAQKMT